MKLIFYPENRLAPIGGPAGYLYNLKKGLEGRANDVAFLPAVADAYTDNSFLRRIVPHRLMEKRRLRNALRLPHAKSVVPNEYYDYEVIHFHETKSMYLCRDFLEHYTGKVVLTSHSPCVYHKELLARLSERDRVDHASELCGLEVIDRYAFERANVIVFPCKEAEEPYFHSWGDYGRVRDTAKMRYLLTGITPCGARKGRSIVREERGIPQDAFVVSYVGRHNDVKGYGDLLAHMPSILRDENVWMLVAGKEGPLFPPTMSRWVEEGWTSDPHSLIAASDVFILPNKETYFDLILLEVLSLGVPVVASATGGNCYFRNRCEGVMLYDSADQIEAMISSFMSKSYAERQRLGDANKSYFGLHHTTDAFAESYLALLDSLV